MKVIMGFDEVLFDQGLKTRGTLKRTYRGTTYYTISAYSDISDLLGDKWFIHGLNAAGDFCYVALRSVAFCLKRRRVQYAYVPDGSSFKKQMYHYGYVIHFTCRGDGIANEFQRLYTS